jgi:hypothetical protein
LNVFQINFYIGIGHIFNAEFDIKFAP